MAMSKLRYLWCGVLILLLVCGLCFAGCGNNIDNLSIKLSASGLVESEKEGEYDLTLVKTTGQDDLSWSAVVSAEVLGISGSMSPKIEWSSDSRYVVVTPNADGTRATITGVTSTSAPTVVTAYSIENRNAEARINVTNIVTPQRITGSKYAAGELGIPLGTPFSLLPGDLFQFYPSDATVPVYEYKIDGVTVSSDEEFTLQNLTDGYATLSAAPLDKSGYTTEQLAALSYTIQSVRIYNPLTDQNTTLTMAGQEGDVSEITLIKNAKNKNKAILTVNAPSSIEYSITSENNIVFDEETNKRGVLSVTFDAKTKQFTLVGVEALDEFCDVNIHFTIAGVKNSIVLTKTFAVRIVDYPTAISVNGVAGSTDVHLRVFDQYQSGVKGTPLRLNISPDSMLFTNISIAVDTTTQAENLTLMSSLLIDNKPFTGSLDNIKSGTTMYLTNSKGYGEFDILVYAADTRGTEDEVVRRITISLEQSVTSMTVDSAVLDNATSHLILEVDEYGSGAVINTRDLTVAITPQTASFDTVTVASEDEDIVDVSITDYTDCVITVRAKKIGQTRITLLAESGVRLNISVRVVARYKTMSISLDPNMSSVMYCADLTVTKPVEGVSDVETLSRAYIAKTGSGDGVYLMSAFYPQAAITSEMVSSIEFISSDNSIASLYNTNSSFYRNVLTTERAGVVSFDIKVKYYRLVGSSLVLQEEVMNSAFTIQVFERVASLSVNESSVELLAEVQSFGVGGSKPASVYDTANNSKTLKVTVNPSNSNITANDAIWSVVGNTSKITLSTTRGSETVVSVSPLAGNSLRVTATIVVSLTDLNGVTFTQEVKIVANKIQQITDVYINNYENSLKNNSLYFELFKDDGYTLDVSVAPTTATNKKLEYIIYDAELLPAWTAGQDVIRVYAGNNKYQYYNVLPRTAGDSAYATQYQCKTADLIYNEADGTYSIKPKRAGYAFVFIIPQDVANQKVDEITEGLTPQLRNVTDRSTIKRIPITVADGESVYYQLYTADDVASIGSTDAGLTKNYYLMNTIDMSAYINKQLNKDSSWEWTPIGSLSKPFSGTVQSMVYGGESPAQSIVGWSLSRNFDSIASGSTTDYRNYGIWGVVTGEIKNINIYINNYTVSQGVFVASGTTALNNYNYGLVVGRLGTRQITVEGTEDTITQYGRLTNVTVYCSNMTYIYARAGNNQNTLVSANLGAVGMLDAGTTADSINVSINSASISSDDLIINFGGIVGKNYGIVGGSAQINNYRNSASVTASVSVTYNTPKATQSTLGGAIGLNFGEARHISAQGSLSSDSQIAILGGVVGRNYYNAEYEIVDAEGNTMQSAALISNVLSAVRISTTAAGTIVGGVVGSSVGGEISFAYYDIYTVLINGTNSSLGLSGSGYTGGIAGTIENTDISYVIVQSYYIDSDVANISNARDSNGAIGGLVGRAKGGSISHSFVNAGLKASTGVVGGILGEAQSGADSATQISDVFARGYLTAPSANSGYAFVGRYASFVSIKDAYADFENDSLDAFYQKNGTVENIYLVRSTETTTDTTNAEIKIINRTELTGKSVAELLFEVDSWAIDSSATTPINGGLPYLLYDGAPFVRMVPNNVEVSARTFETMHEGKINTVLNVGTDDKKLILAYQEDAIYTLSDLFDLSTDLSLGADSISINYSLNNTSVIQLLTTANFVTTQFKVIGTGTVCMRISSSQNARAYDVVQICVIESFDSVDILDENRDSIIENSALGNYTTLKIKHNGSTQVFAEYTFDGQKISNFSGGIKFVTGLRYDASLDALETVRDTEGAILTNYNISIQSWQAGAYGSLDVLYHYVANNDKIALVSVGNDRTTRFVTIIIPYIDVQFYALDADKNITALNSYRYEISEFGELSFETQIYYGVSDIVMGVGDGTQIQSGEKLQAGVTIFNDAYDDSMTIDDLLYYQLYRVLDGGDTEELVAYFDPTLPAAQSVLGSNDIYVNFTDITFVAETNAVIIDYNVELSQTMRKNLTKNQVYRIVIGAIDDNGEKIAKTVSLQWTFTPQQVTRMDIAHYSDAINSGAKLTQAGDTPTNTIVAGEYGLLKISISPDYANFERITLTSSEVNGSPMAFDQRVLEVTTDRTTGEEVYNYLTWQQGVGVITNGISLHRVSLANGAFDGNFYVRTICLRTLPTGTQFTVTVTITQNGQQYSFARTLTVYKTDTLSLEGENYSDILGHYIVAEGTGYVSPNTWVQNQNPLTVQIGAAYYDTEISVDSASAALGASVVRENGKYYLYTGRVSKNNLITVTLTAKQNIGGFTYRATRSITYEVVDFYIRTLRADEVMPTTKRYAFIDEKYYDFDLFIGIDATNINKLTVITFDPSNVATCQKVLDTINSLNGMGVTPYNGWLRRVVESDGRIAFAAIQPKLVADDQWIDNNYQFLTTATGYKVLSSGISTGNILRYEMLFYYDAGSFTLTDSQSDATFGMSTDNINLEFYQVTSQEHPQPIRTLNQFMSMQADIDYILLNDLTITDAWTPLNVAVKSFNGNGYSIHFDATSITPAGEDANYGLFGTIDAKSVIKNVRIVLGADGLAINDGEAALGKLNFGILAGTNNGTVYNCEVYGLNNKQAAIAMSANPASTSVSHNIAGLVAINTGGISNSRVQYTSLRAGGNVAGLVVDNSGTIAGSFYSGGTITNLSETETFATSGLVINNAYDGKITSSYVGGTYTVTDAEGNTSLDTRTAVANTRDATIQSGVTSAGFVYTNYGSIADCYSAVEIFSTKMSGFVFTNYSSGTIARCYSTSDLSGTGSIIASYPFIGANSENASTNNNLNKTNGITNCYYYDSGFANTRLEEAAPLGIDDFCGANGSTVFADYIFSRDGEAGSEFTGVWVFAQKDHLYFTPQRFVSTLQVAADASIDKLYTNFGPKLVSASLIATPRMQLVKSEENAAGEIVHTYANKYTSVFTLEENGDYFTDYSYDPIVVSNMEQFNSAFDAESDNLVVKGEGSGAIILSNIRIVSDLNQSNLANGETLHSPSANYAGILAGNGFEFGDISLAVNSQDIEAYGLIGRLSRVTATVDDTTNYIGTIKNYSATVSNIACSTVTYVGGLVGWVDSANLYDVEVTNQYGRVVGNNVVGGIAGYVTGTSRIHTAFANVGVTANYRANTEKIYNHDLVRVYGLETARKVNIDLVGYAGGLFGIIDLTPFDQTNPSSSDPFEARVYNISNNSNASVVGKIAGGLIGGVGEYSVIYKAKKTVITGALVKGYVFAGGIAGQNNGFIKYASVEYTSDIQAIVDAARTGETVADAYLDYFNAGTSPLAIGGIVGLNIGSNNINWPGGTIQLSSTKIAIRDSTAGNAGGIAGAVYGGDLRACLATGGIVASNRAYVGGIVGYLSDFSADNAILIGMDNPFGEAKTCGTTLDYLVGMNNYLASDYNYYYTLYTNDTKGINGAIGGIVGYVLDRSLIYTTHTVANGSDDPYAYLTHPSNYFVSQISNRVLSTALTTPLNSGTGYFDLYQEDDLGVMTFSRAVGKYGSDTTLNLAQGKTRGYMMQNRATIFDGWDEYSLDTSSGTPSIVEKDLPDIIEISTIQDLSIMYWHPDKDYVLVDDIDFQDHTAPAGEKRILAPFYAIGSESSPFTGSFTSRAKADGSLPVIKNVYIINSDASSIGFFGAISNAHISNIIIQDIHYNTALNKNVKAWVGGLAGVVTNSTVQNVSIRITDTANSGIFTNANVAGGMFGLVRSLNDGETLIEACYVENNLILGDNVYSAALQTGAVAAYYGGFAGQITGDVTISGAMAVGDMTVNYTDMTTTTMTAQNASEIEHIVGGFAGQISGEDVTESACVSAVDVILNNVLSHTRAGGFAGVIGGTKLTKVDSHSNLNINFANLNDTKILYVGGLVGEQRNASTLTGFVSAGDIRLNGTYGINTLNTTATHHFVAGIVGHLGDSAQVSSGYSVASIINNTMFANLDMGFASGDISGVSNTGSVKVDRSYALTAGDRANVGTTSSAVQGGGGLDIGTGLFVRDDAQLGYYRIKNTATQNEYFNTAYAALYAINTGSGKTAPIRIANSTDFATNMASASDEYQYYLQITDITLGNTNKLYGTGTQVSEFIGSYNGGGSKLILPAHFDLAHVSTPNCGLFGTVTSTASQPSMILGVVMTDVMIYANLMSTVENFGIIAGETTANTIMANCYISGELNLNVGGTTAIGGLVGSSGGIFIGCATDIDANLDGSSAYRYGAIYGVANTQNSHITLFDVQSAGKITNSGSQAIVAGIIADNSASTLYAKNCYTATEIASASTTTANVVYELGTKAHNAAGIWYDPTNSLDKTKDAVWEIYDYSTNRGQNFVGSNYVARNDRNYGLPILKWLNDSNLATETGVGTATNPYIIDTAAQFGWMLENNTSSRYYILNSDIDYRLVAGISGYSAGAFAGTLNGNYHYIRNINSTLFTTIGGSVTKLGFDNVSVAADTAILANSTTSASTVSQIYAAATTGKVIGSGLISNSLSNGATFGEDATNCFATVITDEVYNGLDTTIWAYNGQGYTLSGFISDCRTLAKPIGTMTVGALSSGSRTLTAQNAQDLYNALFYATHYSGRYKINCTFTTLDLDGYALNVPNSVSEITGLTTIQDGYLSANAMAKIKSTSLSIQNCGLASDTTNPLLGDSNASAITVSLSNCRVIANRAGGLLYTSITAPFTLNITNTRVFLNSQNVDLVAGSRANATGTVTINVTNLGIYGGKIRSVINTIDGGTTDMTLSNVSGTGSIENVVSTNAGTVTIDLNTGVSLDSNTNSIIGTNSDTANINVNSVLTATGLENFAFVQNSSGVVNLTISAATSLSGTTISGVVGTYSCQNATTPTITVTLNANYAITATTSNAIIGGCANGVTFDEETNLTFTPNTYQLTVNGAAFGA